MQRVRRAALTLLRGGLVRAALVTVSAEIGDGQKKTDRVWHAKGDRKPRRLNAVGVYTASRAPGVFQPLLEDQHIPQVEPPVADAAGR